MRVIFFTRSLPNVISDELSRQGHTVHEALAISEVLAFAEQHPEAQIVISADVDNERACIIAQHYPTLWLTETATTSEIMWQLSNFTSSAPKSFDGMHSNRRLAGSRSLHLNHTRFRYRHIFRRCSNSHLWSCMRLAVSKFGSSMDCCCSNTCQQLEVKGWSSPERQAGPVLRVAL